MRRFRSLLRTITLLALSGSALLLGACAIAPPAERPEALLADRLFGPPSERVSTAGVLQVDDAMRRYLAVDIAPQLRRQGAQDGLIEALYKHSQLKLDYDTGRTRTAAEAFAARSGNCLSLVLMTAALAHALNLPVVYQSAYLDETWSRNGDLLFASGHVNVTVGRSGMDAASSHTLSPLTVDFLPPRELAGMRTREISESTVLAMFANNRAAESLAQGRLDDAYAWAAESTRQDPGYVSAYNTLGVVYLRHDNLDLASASFEHALSLDPRNTRAMSNLAQSDERNGKPEAAAALRARLAVLEPFPPFHFFRLGMAAMERADWTAARGYFSREVERADDDDEFHFWLGLANWRLGDVDEAGRQLRLAMDDSTTRGQHDLYAAKLAWLRAHSRRAIDGSGTGAPGDS